MNAWIILLFLLMGNSNCGCNQRDDWRDNDGDCGCDRDRDRDRDRGRDRDCDRDRNDSRFEPRFEARPFSDREACGCEERDN